MSTGTFFPRVRPSYRDINIQRNIALLQRELAIVVRRLDDLQANRGEMQRRTQQERDDLRRELEISQRVYNQYITNLRKQLPQGGYVVYA